MKKRIVQSMLLSMITCSLSGFCFYQSSLKQNQENENIQDYSQMTIAEYMATMPTITASNVDVVKSDENDYLEILSQPVVFPDSYYDPNNEEFREEEFWDDMELIALVCQAEAESESEYGKRLVIDSILNRLDSPYFPNDIKEIIYAPGQFECVSNNRINHVENNEYIASLVIEEFNNRTNKDVIYFRTDYFFDFGKPLLKEGNHCFSGR